MLDGSVLVLLNRAVDELEIARLAFALCVATVVAVARATVAAIASVCAVVVGSNVVYISVRVVIFVSLCCSCYGTHAQMRRLCAQVCHPCAAAHVEAPCSVDSLRHADNTTIQEVLLRGHLLPVPQLSGVVEEAVRLSLGDVFLQSGGRVLVSTDKMWRGR